jgi:hypothetical protein
MSKPRLPADIDFLIESVMAETPDKVTFFASDVAKLKAAGKTNVKVGGLNWHRKDTVAFFVHDDAKVVPYSNMKHWEMEEQIREASAEAFLNPNDFNQKYTSYVDETGNINFSDVGGAQAIGLYGLTDDVNNPGIAVRRYLRTYVRYFRSFSIRGKQEDTPDNIARADVTAGRVWRRQAVVSFWNDKDSVMHHMKLLFGFMNSLKLNKSSCIYEFLDIRGFFTYDELFKKSDDREKLSAEEKLELLKKIHLLPPDKKKEAMKKLGMVNVDRDAEKAGKGFDNAAMAQMAMPALEETIKLKNLLGGHQ